MGALYAGCELYFGYPITPASEIAHGAAKWFPMLGRTFVQAECETASVNMMFGAAGAGKLSMTATSGPGFSLMQEGLSYLAGAELPSVVVNINRAGPGLGNVYPEQSDYTPAVKGGGHGSYQTFTLAPASAQEMFDLTIKAFEMSAKWRTPAVVYADGLQGQMMETVTLPDEVPAIPDFSDWAAQGEAKTRENLVKSIYLDAAQQAEFNRHLQEKYAAMAADAMGEAYLADGAELGQNVDAFTGIDKRALVTLKYSEKKNQAIDSFTAGWHVFKYNNLHSNETRDIYGEYDNLVEQFASIDFPLLRSAESYLIYAEAKTRIDGGSTADAKAVKCITDLQKRAGLNPAISSITLDNVFTEITRELYWEGLRRTTLIRFDKFVEGNFVWPFKGGAESGQALADHMKLFPIPDEDLVANTNLKQNGGY